MKVCINMLENSANIGPVIFARRLAGELEKIGVDIVGRQDRHDILLAFIRDSNIEYSRGGGAKIIQRLDGIYHNLDVDYNEKNSSIGETRREVDAVIYQSKFSKAMVNRYLGKVGKMSFVIPNGADSCEFRKENNGNDKVTFLCSARWRPDKRLDSIVEGFRFSNIPNSELIVLGAPDMKSDLDNVNYLGEISPSALSKYYSSADYFIHLAYNDSCPNSVIEALVSELPVICAESGGTKELVKGSGEVVLEDVLSFEPLCDKDIPFIDSREVADSLHRCMERKSSYEFPREDLYIGNCAKNYKMAFEKVLSYD